MKVQSKVVAFDQDKQTRTLLKAWVAAVERYTHLFEGDNPWWYNERASLSTLAGAAWSMEGWVALEEFSTGKREKAPVDGVEAGTLANGRCDLFLSDKKQSFAIEAKQAWQPIGYRANGTSYLRKAQHSAWEDCWHLKDEADRKFAATFVVPTINLNEACWKSEDGEPCHDTIARLVLDWLVSCGTFASTRNRRTSYAYTFPGLGETVYSNGSHCFPGVVLVLEEMLPGTRRPKKTEG